MNSLRKRVILEKLARTIPAEEKALLQSSAPLGGTNLQPKEVKSIKKVIPDIKPLPAVVKKSIINVTGSVARRAKAERSEKGGFHDVQRRVSMPVHQSTSDLGLEEDVAKRFKEEAEKPAIVKLRKKLKGN